MSLGGFHGLVLQKKIIQNDYKIVTTKEGLETTNNDLTFIPYCEFQREGFCQRLATLRPLSINCVANSTSLQCKKFGGRVGGEIISCRNFFCHSNQEKQHPGFHRGLILWSTERISAFVDRLIQSIAQKKKTRIYKIRQTS